MAELRAHNSAKGMMVDEGLAVLTGRRAGPVPPGRERAVGLTGIASTAASEVKAAAHRGGAPGGRVGG